MWVSTNYARNLPGPVIVGGVTYNGTGATRSWASNDNTAANQVVGTFSGQYSKLTIACFYTPTTTVLPYNSFDQLVVLGNGTAICLGLVYSGQYGQYLEVESQIANYQSTDSPPVRNIVSGHSYWLNLHYDGPAELASLAVFDPDNSFAQVGSTVSAATLNSVMTGPIWVGRSDGHGNNTAATSQTYYSNIVVDYTNAAFPLIPSSGTDTTPPSVPPTVRDGTGSDIAYTSSSTQLSANWDASTDNESGISGYQYAIGTTAGGTQTMNWTSLTNVLTVTKTGLSLTNGQTYFFSVKAVNGVGLTGSATNSNGQKVDTTAPSAPATVRDGTGTDISTTSSTTQLSANWDASTDSDSGISGYQYAIGTTAGGTQTVNWTSLSNVTTVTKTGLSLTVGQTYYFSVKAVNGAGLVGSATNSNGQTVVDTTAPSAPPAVRDGTGADIAYTSSTTQLSANWDASTDAESGISGYQYAIGTTAGGTQTVNWTSLTNVLTVTKTGLSLTSGQTYFFSVTAVNGAGLTGSATNSNGQKVDSTAPSVPPAVRDGTGTDISTTNSTTQLSANWDASTDNESGISGYQYTIGTTAGGTQTVNWTSLSNVLTVTKTGLSLTVGQTYYFSVKTVNGAGLTGNATNSNGQTVVSGGGSVTYFQDNFESWIVHGGAWSSVSGETSTHTLNTSTDYAKAGAKGLKLTDTDTTATSGACLVKNFSPVISGDLYTRFYVFFPTGFGSTNSGCTRRVLRVWCGSNRAQMSFKDGVPNMEEVGAWGSAKGSAISEGAWHCIEMHGATPSASTLLEFWVDGIKNSTTLYGSFSGSTTWDNMDLGDTVLGGGTNGTGAFYMDEVVVSNSYVGTGITSPVTYFSDNFESWSVHGGAWSSISGESASHTLNTSTDQARSGTKSLKLTDTDSTGINGAYLTKNFSPAISGDIYARFYVYLPTGYEAANPGAARRLLRILCGSNRGQISVKAGGQLIMEEIGTWGSVSGSSLSEAAWHCIEMHGTAPAATTLLEFWVDGVLNSTALMANFSASSTWDHVDLGDIGLGGGANGDGTFYLDEAVVSNFYVGPLP
jgi:YHS domain-containing protein